MPRQTSIQDLPPALLELCWAPLDLCERHRTVPFACRSWRQQLNSSPQLLHTITVEFKQQPSPDRFRSFFEWMHRWGASRVQLLTLHVAVSPDAEWAAQELAAMLAALLCACGTAGALRQLRLKHNLNVTTTAWLATMRQLSVLHIDVYDEGFSWEAHLEYDPPKWSLAGLQELNLLATHTAIPATAHLPTALTRLWIEGTHARNSALPSQIAALPQLCELRLGWADPPPDSFAALGALSSLRRLVVDNCPFVPASLPWLTQLDALAITGSHVLPWGQHGQQPGPADILQAALPAMAGQLTCLALPDSMMGLVAPPALLTSCSGLQALFVTADTDPFIDEHQYVMPPGPALPTLRFLSGPLGLLARSMGSLRAATRLEFVGAVCFPPEVSLLPILLSWAAQHPTLRHLALEGAEAELCEHFHRIDDARRHNPQLRITRHHSEESEVFVGDRSLLLTECGFDALYNHCAP